MAAGCVGQSPPITIERSDVMNKALVSVEQLEHKLGAPDWLIIDCRFSLADASAGYANYLEAHIPGAVYAHLDRDLSGRSVTDTGRHPLPAAAHLCERFSALGVSNDSHVVAYDDAGGMVAARLWWMLRYMGHEDVAVLDGGWPAWAAAAMAVETNVSKPTRGKFTGTARGDRLVRYDAVPHAGVLVDAREPARYRGESEPIDPVAGHIPGARNHFWQSNLDEVGKFLSPTELRDQFSSTLGMLPDSETVHYCGSGVSACHNILAQVVAGLPEPRLYCGSWSEWCQKPGTPVG